MAEVEDATDAGALAQTVPAETLPVVEGNAAVTEGLPLEDEAASGETTSGDGIPVPDETTAQNVLPSEDELPSKDELPSEDELPDEAEATVDDATVDGLPTGDEAAGDEAARSEVTDEEGAPEEEASLTSEPDATLALESESADALTVEDEVLDSSQMSAVERADATESLTLVTQSSDEGSSITSGAITVSGLDEGNVLAVERSTENGTGSRSFDLKVRGEVGSKVRITSSNTKVAAVDFEGTQDGCYQIDYESYDGSYWFYSTINAKGLGSATITITYTPKGSTAASSTLAFKVICYPDVVKGTAVKKATNTKVNVSWTSLAGVSGYKVYRSQYDDKAQKYVLKLLATRTNTQETSLSVLAPWGEYCTYVVLPFVNVDGKQYSCDATEYYVYSNGSSFTLDYPKASKPTAKRATYNKVRLTWNKTSSVTGYKVYRAKADEWGYANGEYKLVSTVKGDATTSTTVGAAWKASYCYAVRPYSVVDGKTYVMLPTAEWYSDSVETVYALPKPTVRIKSVIKASAKKLKVSWKAYKGATAYRVYRSTIENSGYSCIAKLKGSAGSYTCKATPGTIYYFKVIAVYGKAGEVKSASVAQQIPLTPAKGNNAAKAKKASIAGLSYWGDARDTYTYTQGGKTYVVYLKGSSIVVVGYDKNCKRVSKKKISFGGCDVWGGFYHGPDNNNYVITGSPNYKESKKKVVIRVTKYSSKWKKGKTATIKGGASNSFTGIYEPFSWSSVALDMQGPTLYLMTGLTMFQTDDGLHHQSNIGFKIDTKTMKATVSNISYASHSFGQLVRFKDGTLYVADHGDAYPRAMQLTWQEGYGTKQAGDTMSVNAFEIMGDAGNNYTGASLDGMEVSNSTVLMCGTSVPQGYGVKGVKGDSWELQSNLYLTVTDRASGKTAVKWLTQYSPKGKSGVSNAKMVKLSDSRFGILYTVTKDGKNSLHYRVITANGKKVLTRTIKGATLYDATQPVYVGGRIMWAAADANYKPRVYSIQAL